MIIGFTGKATAGKNTAAEFLGDFYEEHGVKVKYWSFAEKLKISAAACFGVEEKFAVDWCNEVKNKAKIRILFEEEGYQGEVTGREFLQYYGTEAHREIFGENFWVDALMDEIIQYHHNTGGSLHDNCLDLITDVRFPNEAHAVHANYGKVVEIQRPSIKSNDTHISEQSLDDVDLRLINDGSLLTFGKTVIHRVSELMHEYKKVEEVAEYDYEHYRS